MQTYFTLVNMEIFGIWRYSTVRQAKWRLSTDTKKLHAFFMQLESFHQTLDDDRCEFLRKKGNPQWVWEENDYEKGGGVSPCTSGDRVMPQDFGEEEDRPRCKKVKRVTNEDASLRQEPSYAEPSSEPQTAWAVKLLKEWLLEAGQDPEFELMDSTSLDELLQHFYSAVQTKKGTEYSKSALIALRFGLNRYLTSPPFCKNICIQKDREFMASNQVLRGLIKSLQKQGKDVIRRTEPLLEEDIERLYRSGVFAEDSPRTLQNKVLYEVLCQFGRRGRVGLHDLLKTSFIIMMDSEGRRYVTLTPEDAGEIDNPGGNSSDTTNERMYETQGPFCPLKSFEKYLSKLHPDCPNFFQTPLRRYVSAQEIWYTSCPVGVNKLHSFMSRMSKEAGLSRNYNNHSIRAMVKTGLREAGFTKYAIRTAAGQKNLQNLMPRAKSVEEEKRRLHERLLYNSSEGQFD